MLERLGEFQIKKQLGEGGMGAVYLAYQDSLERDVALKVLTERLCQNDEFIQRFKREARSAASIIHPNVIQIYAIGEDSGIHYFAMEAVKGKDLAEIMGEGKKFSIEESLDIVTQVAEALACASEVGIIHRDLKPANIMLTDKGLAKVTDFGLAKSASAEMDVTAAGTIVGTANYMSPEQGQGKKLDVRTDIYSLGVVFFEILTGRIPFIAEQTSAVLYMHVFEPPPVPSKYNPAIPPVLDRMVLRMLAKNVDDRPRDADALLAELRGVRQSIGTGGGKVPATAPAISQDELDREEAGSHLLDELPAGALKVLIAEDVPVVRQLYAKILTKMGFAVMEASNGEEALDLWRVESPDLVLLDLNMPKKDGLTVLREKNESGGLDAQIIVISARKDQDAIQEVTSYAGCTYLTKPINVHELRNRIKGVMATPKGRMAVSHAVEQRGGPEKTKKAEVSRQVVVYDRSQHARSLYRGVLESLGHQVACLDSAKEMDAILAEDLPDLFVASISRRSTEDSAVLEAIKTKASGVKAIFVASEQDFEMETAFAKMNCGPVLMKPVRLGNFRWAVEKAFSESKPAKRVTIESNTFSRIVKQQLAHDNEYTIFDFSRDIAGVLSEGARKSYESRIADGSLREVETAVTNLLRKLKSDNKLEIGMRYLRHAYLQGSLEVRNFCLALLPELLSPLEEVEVLVKVITDEDFRIRCHVLGRLGDLQSEDSIPIIVRFLNDDVWKVRKAAAQCLERFNISKTIEPLIIFYARSKEELPDRIRNHLFGGTGASELNQLEKIIEHSGPEVKAFIADFLGDLKSKLSVQILLKLMDDESPRVKAAACRAGGKVQNDRLYERLLTSLTDTNSEIQQAAVDGLKHYRMTPSAYVYLDRLAGRGKRINPEASQLLNELNSDDAKLGNLLENLSRQSEGIRRYLSLYLSMLFPGKDELEAVVRQINSVDAIERRDGISRVLNSVMDAARAIGRKSGKDSA